MKSNIFKYVFFLFVIILIGYAIYLFSHHETEEQQQPEEQTSQLPIEKITNIRLGIAEYDTMNPILSNNRNVQEISPLIFESLLAIDQDYRIQTKLAKEWSRTSATSYVIKLKDNIKWQNGTQFTAYDVKFTIDLLKQIPSIYAYNVQYVTGVEVLDATTIKITLSKEIPFFEYYLTFPIMCNNYYEGEEFKTSSHIPIGTGMFKISTIENNTILLEKNSNYWNIEQMNPVLEKITISLYESMGEVYNSFKIGNIDLINTNVTNIEEYVGTIGFIKKEYKGREFDFLALNCADSILNKKEVRQAISYAIDKWYLVSSVYQNKYDIADFPLDYGNYAYEQTRDAATYQRDGIAKLLQENGWKLKNKVWQKKENDKTIKLSFSLVVKQSDTNRVKVAEMIQNSLQEVGIQITLKKVSDKEYNTYLEKKNYDILLTGTYNSYSPDVSFYLAEGNLANFREETCIDLLNEIKGITDEQLLKEKMKQIVAIYQEEVPYIGLYRNRQTAIISPNLVGKIEPNNANLFYHIENWYRQ